MALPRLAWRGRVRRRAAELARGRGEECVDLQLVPRRTGVAVVVHHGRECGVDDAPELRIGSSSRSEWCTPVILSTQRLTLEFAC